MATGEQWGVGDQADAKAFDTIKLGNREAELIFGQYPHSRQDNNVYARFPNGRIEEFSGHRRPVEILIEESNYLKESDLSGDEIRMGGKYVVKLAGVAVDGGFSRHWDRAMTRIAYRLPKIQEHAIDWTKESAWRGRKVLYDNVPAVVVGFNGEEGVCVLVPDDGWKFPTPTWALKESWQAEEWEESYSARLTADILSEHIWWFRD